MARYLIGDIYHWRFLSLTILVCSDTLPVGKVDCDLCLFPLQSTTSNKG